MPKVKGAHVLSAIKTLRAYREQALQLLPPHLHKYLQERILASMWYPFDDHLELLRAIGVIVGGSDPWLLIGRAAARLDLAGLYNQFLRIGDPASTLKTMPAMWKSAHDSGEITLTKEGPGQVLVRLRGFIPRSAEICGICTGYLVESVIMACGKHPRVTHTECRARGANECSWSVTWPET